MLILCVFFPYSHCLAKKIPKYIKKQITNCYSNNFNVKGLIHTDGYYDLIEVLNEKDTFKIHIVFFEDGSFLYNVVYNNANSLKDFFQKLSNHDEYKDSIYGGDWGIFRIKADIITAQFINNPVLFDTWSAWEIKFKIINNAIVFIDKRALHKTSKQEKDQLIHELLKRKTLPLKFIQSPIPPPYSWLKKLDWIWCDKSK